MRPGTWIIVVGAVWLGCARGQTDGSQEQTEGQGRIVPLKKTWERAIPLQRVPEGLRTLRASECGECHVEIHAEWRASTHAKALHDPQFQAEWK